MFGLIALIDAVFCGLQFGIKYLVKSFDLKVEPGGVKVFEHPVCYSKE
jgi:hypothetical protein